MHADAEAILERETKASLFKAINNVEAAPYATTKNVDLNARKKKRQIEMAQSYCRTNCRIKRHRKLPAIIMTPGVT